MTQPSSPRRGILQILYSPAGRFRKVVLAPAEERTIGRGDDADIAVHDPTMESVHASVFFDGVGLFVRDLSREPSGPHFLIDGAPIPVGELVSGGTLVVGRTTLRFHLEARTPCAPNDWFEPMRDTAPLRAHADAGHLYGVFDAARSDRVLPLLDEAIDPHASLHEGAQGAVLDEVAPYLVRFEPKSGLLERLLGESWGAAWGIFFRSTFTPKEVRRHLRRFLMVVNDETEERMYFRFYDPRVLREFLRVARPRQRASLFAAIDEIFLEAEDLSILRFGATESAVRDDVEGLSGPVT